MTPETDGRAVLMLEDGTVFRGRAFGAPGETTGEIVFNTAMTGYQEILTDPSYAGQIVAMTCPEIGNTGVNPEDMESERPFLRGFVVREYIPVPSSWRSTESLDTFLRRHGIVGIEGIDTRRLVRRIRSAGAMRAVLSTADFDEESLLEKACACPGLVGRDLVRTVTTAEPHPWTEGTDRRFYRDAVPGRPPDRPRGVRRVFRVTAFDFGAKWNILRLLVDHGCEVTVVPATTGAREILEGRPDGIFLSNGPGDPAGVVGVTDNIRDLLGRGIPLFGICLGHQMLALAAGARTFKMKFGHRGANQPVRDLATGKVEITSQNHGFAVDPDSLEGTGFEVSHVNLNDGTVEGLSHRDLPVFSVQYHPEASPGPRDASHLFDRFIRMMEASSAPAD
jgi:carbamoyl-phosphate synthase small subunit